MNAGNYATTTKNVIMNYALNENLDQVIENYPCLAILAQQFFGDKEPKQTIDFPAKMLIYHAE